MSDLRAIDSFRLHSDADRVPVPDHGDLGALRASLRDNGQQDPIDVTADDVILDGRSRWALLRDLGAETIQVRVVDIPDTQQVAYMIGRAVARRHLSTHQKKDLNEWLRAQVVEVVAHPKTGEEMRVGMGQSQRAASLGVDRESVRQWDKEVPAENLARTAEPTHYRQSSGKVQPLHPDRKPREPQRSAAARPEPLRKARAIPYWSRQFSTWCRGARPEDRDFLRRIDREVHAALDRNGIACERENAS